MKRLKLNGDSERHINRWVLRNLTKVCPQDNESKEKREINCLIERGAI